MMIKVGILGCASIARRSLAPAFMEHPEFVLSAVASRYRQKACEFVSGLGNVGQEGVRTLTYEEMVNDNAIDLIYCPLPTGMHYEWVEMALRARKHVLCEKSLATNFKEVEDLVATAKGYNRFLMESFQFRFHAQNLYVKGLLEKNAIGPLRQVSIRFGMPPFPDGASNIRYSESLGGGALLDAGAYTVKAATYLLGEDIQVLSAMSGERDPSLGGVDLTGAIMMRSGDVAIHAAYGFDNFYQNSYEIWGKGGIISTVRAFTAREDFPAAVTIDSSSGHVVKTFKDNHFMRMLTHVAKVIESGRYEREYAECLAQARLLNEVRKIGNVQ